MGIRDTALNIVIRAKDLTKGTLERFRRDVKQTDETAEKASSSGLRRLSAAVTGVVAAYASFATVRSLISGVISTGDKFEKLAIQMRAVMGSIEEGDRATAWITDFTKDTPLQLEQTTEAFLRLKNFGLDPMDGTLQAIVDQNEKLGGGQERLTGIANALGQAWAKQKLQGEEVLQLVERGVPVYELLEKVTGQTGEALADMQANGELTRDVIAQLIEEMGKAADGAAVANMTTLSGIVSNLRDRWELWLNTVAESGALDSFKVLLNDIAANMDRLAKDGSLQRWAESTSKAIVGFVEGMKSLVVGIYDARGAIKLFITAWAGLKLSAAVGSVRNLALAFSGGLTSGISGSARAATAFGTALKAIAWAGLIQAALTIASAFSKLKEAKEQLNEAMQAQADVEAEAAKRLAQFTEQTGIAATSLDDLIQMQDEGLVVFDKANQRWITGAEAVTAYKNSLEATRDATGEVVESLEDQLIAAVDSAVSKFKDLTAGGENTREALEDVLGDYDLGITEDVQQVVAVLAELEAQGLVTADTIREELGGALEKMSSDELTAFAINARFAFEQGITGAEAFAETIDQTVSAALRNLGVDVKLIEEGISTVGADAIAQFELVAQNIAASGDSAELAGDKIVAAFTAAFKRVETDAGRTQLLEALRRQLQAGLIDGKQFQEAIAAVGDQAELDSEKVANLSQRIRDMRAAMQEAREAGSLLGEGVQEGAATGGSAMALVIGAIEGYKQQLQEFGDAAVEAFEETALGMQPAADETDNLRGRLEQLKFELQDIRETELSLADTSGLQSYLSGLRKSAREVELQVIEQKLALNDLLDTYEAGGISAERFISKAQRMAETSDLLDQQDLSVLRRGIESATADMERLEGATDRTLSNLQNKLDRLRGDTEAAEKRQYEQQIADLETQLETARRQKNEEAIADLEESLDVAKQIYEIEKQNRAEEARERAAREAERQRSQTGAGENSQRETGTQQQQNAGSRQVFELRAGGLSAEVSSDNPAALLELLDAVGLRTS